MIKKKICKLLAVVALVLIVFSPPVLPQEIQQNNSEYESLAYLGTDAVSISTGSIAVGTIQNVPDAPAIPIGVSELSDFASLFFCGYEAYIKASADQAVNMSDIQYLLPVAMAIVPAFSGATQIISELKSLTDDQVKSLLLIANDYQLGNHAQRAKQVFKTVLILAQTYFVFENASSQ